MHRANLTIITIPILLLARYGRDICHGIRRRICKRKVFGRQYKSSAAVSNECLNPILDSNTIDNAVGVGNCGGTVSQQDESGQASAPITHQTANPTLEVQRSTQPPDTETPTTHTCDDCFDMLTAAQQEAFEQILAPGGGSPLGSVWPTGITTIEDLCEAWAAFSTATKEVAFDDIGSILIEIQANDMIDNMVRCLFASVG